VCDDAIYIRPRMLSSTELRTVAVILSCTAELDVAFTPKHATQSA